MDGKPSLERHAWSDDVNHLNFVGQQPSVEVERLKLERSNLVHCVTKKRNMQAAVHGVRNTVQQLLLCKILNFISPELRLVQARVERN